MAIKVALLGVGRMGKSVAKKVLGDSELELVAAVCASDAPEVGQDMGVLAGVGECGVKVAALDALESVLDGAAPDVAVDFTVAEAFLDNLDTLVSRKINLVVGTTGLDDERPAIDEKIEDAGVGAVISSNMSTGVNYFFKTVGDTAGLLGPGYEVVVVETHHVHKKDAPSGTARRIARILAEATGRGVRELGVIKSEDEAQPTSGVINVYSVRRGEVVGEHKVVFTSAEDRIEFFHHSNSRDIFSAGVVKAVKYVNGKKGVYSMKEVLGI